MKIFLPKQYTNLKFYNRIVTLKTVLWGIWAGFAAGLVITYYNKVYLGSLVRYLIENGIFSEDKALTTEETGIKHTWLLKRSLKNGSLLRKYISIANPEDTVKKVAQSPASEKLRKVFLAHPEKYSYDFDRMKLYIPEDKKYQAEARFENKKKNPWTLIIWIASLTALAILVEYILLPDMLQMLDNFLTRHLN